MSCIKMNSQGSVIPKTIHTLPMWMQSEIDRILKRGNTAEVKKERGEYVIIEVHRKAIRQSNN